MTGYFLFAFIYLVAAVIAVPIAKRLGLGSVLGYLIAGLVIGPIFGLVGDETVAIQHFAEFVRHATSQNRNHDTSNFYINPNSRNNGY